MSSPICLHVHLYHSLQSWQFGNQPSPFVATSGGETEFLMMSSLNSTSWSMSLTPHTVMLMVPGRILLSPRLAVIFFVVK